MFGFTMANTYLYCVGQEGRHQTDSNDFFHFFFLQTEAPGSPNISVTTGATSLIVKWAPPANNGGSSVSKYRVEIVHGSHGFIKSYTIRAPSRKVEIVKLQKDTNYTVRVSAGNVVSYGKPAEIFTKTKFVGGY